jgi:hypothetical protein
MAVSDRAARVTRSVPLVFVPVTYVYVVAILTAQDRVATVTPGASHVRMAASDRVAGVARSVQADIVMD